MKVLCVKDAVWVWVQGVRPSWLAGGSYKYFLSKPAHPLDRPCWLSAASVPAGHPLAAPLGPSLGPSLGPCLHPRALDPPLGAPLPGGPAASPTATRCPRAWSDMAVDRRCSADGRQGPRLGVR